MVANAIEVEVGEFHPGKMHQPNDNPSCMTLKSGI
jgi:hypothetical protein